jgi:hypothetical protein
MRSRSGASMILIVVFAILLIAALVAGFKYCMYLGGSSEVRNAVDAAALNVSKRVCQLKVPPQGVYGDCVDNTGTIGLANINRVWGKSWLINANAQSMQQMGAAKPDAVANAEQAYTQAQNINDSLGAQLKDKQILDQYFNQVANNRPASMIGSQATVSTDRTSTWATAMVDRGGPSNLSFEKGQIPPGMSVAAAGKYFAGYTPLAANNKHFCFVTFKPPTRYKMP